MIAYIIDFHSGVTAVMNGEKTPVNVEKTMIMCFTLWSKQHSMMN